LGGALSDSTTTKFQLGNQDASKFVSKVRQRILKSVKAGNYRVRAAEIAGISSRTFIRWMNKGLAEPDGPYGKFRAQVLDAEAAVEDQLVDTVRVAALKDPWLALEYLGRKYPERWAKESKLIRELTQCLKLLEKQANAGPVSSNGHLQPGEEKAFPPTPAEEPRQALPQ
jgi:hypothetical protein